LNGTVVESVLVQEHSWERGGGDEEGSKEARGLRLFWVWRIWVRGGVVWGKIEREGCRGGPQNPHRGDVFVCDLRFDFQ
jgi:hypothetical protein